VYIHSCTSENSFNTSFNGLKPLKPYSPLNKGTCYVDGVKARQWRHGNEDRFRSGCKNTAYLMIKLGGNLVNIFWWDLFGMFY